MFGKSLAVNRDVQAGEVLTSQDLEGKKPSDAGIPVSELAQVIGRRLKRRKQRWDFLEKEDLE
jgi:N-acetylneuraminate synthase